MPPPAQPHGERHSDGPHEAEHRAPERETQEQHRERRAGEPERDGEKGGENQQRKARHEPVGQDLRGHQQGKGGGGSRGSARGFRLRSRNGRGRPGRAGWQAARPSTAPPGPSAARTCCPGPDPRRKSVTTMTKNTSGCRISTGERHAISRSRLSMPRKALPAGGRPHRPSSRRRCPALPSASGRCVLRSTDSAGFNLPGEQVLHQPRAVFVQRGEGFVQKPQRSRPEQQPGKRGAPALAGGKGPRGRLRHRLEAESVNGGLGSRAAAEPRRHFEVLPHAERELDSVLVAHVAKRREVRLALSAQRASAPSNLPRLRFAERAQHAQQGGLPAAVGSVDLQHLSRRHRQVEIPKQHPAAAKAGKAVRLEHGSLGTGGCSVTGGHGGALRAAAL